MSGAAETILRFLVGGVIVTVFAAIGAIFRPKTFAGIFGAAPSIALATLALTISSQGGQYAAVEARSMLLGAAGLMAYSWVVCRLLVRSNASALTATLASMGIWFAAALGLYFLLLGRSGAQW
jgi:hypothetical protein